ncbi:hypothetical protein AX14_013867 [Amanita brunnescens Koide BX004]|nr:hypothetical protein AX14_013867 [Amanita brunnescens Koide BX004]
MPNSGIDLRPGDSVQGKARSARSGSGTTNLIAQFDPGMKELDGDIVCGNQSIDVFGTIFHHFKLNVEKQNNALVESDYLERSSDDRDKFSYVV